MERMRYKICAPHAMYSENIKYKHLMICPQHVMKVEFYKSSSV